MMGDKPFEGKETKQIFFNFTLPHDSGFGMGRFSKK